MSDLQKTAVRGGMWTFSAQGFTFVCQLASVIILARILEPEDFGLVGLLASLLAVLSLLRQTGLSTAIIQRQEIKDGDLVRLWHASIILGLLLVGLVVLMGFGAAWLMDDPRLARIAPWYAVSFFFGAFETVPVALLRRRLKFKKIAVRDGVSQLCGSTSAILSAYVGFGYWALVVGPFVTSLVNMITSWAAARWVPRGSAASWRDVLPYLGFGGAFSVSGVAAYFTRNLDSVLIGKVWGYETLGFYTRARTLMLNPLGQIMGPIGSVLIPVLCRLRDDRDQFISWVSSLTSIFLLGSGPVAALLMVASPELVTLLLGDGWERVIKPFMWLSMSLYVFPFGSLLYWVLTSSGKVRLLLNWTWTSALVTVLAVVASVGFGAVAVAAAFSLSGVFGRITVALWFAGKTGLIDVRRSVQKYILGLLHACAWFGFLTFIASVLRSHELPDIAVLIGLGTVWAAIGAGLIFGTAQGRNFIAGVRSTMTATR